MHGHFFIFPIRLRALILLVFALVLPHAAFAACTVPTGNEGDINYSATQHLMGYCNGTSWVAMGSTNYSGPSFGTLTTNDFCTATNGTAIACTTASSGSGNVALTTSPVFTTPNLGTPSVLTLTNATGLPIATGVSGLGTGVAAFLATPSSANFAAAVTGETGTGALVFATSPTLVTPALGTPSSGVLTNTTGIGTASMTAVTGTANATTYLRGDGTWAAVVGGGITAVTTVSCSGQSCTATCTAGYFLTGCSATSYHTTYPTDDYPTNVIPSGSNGCSCTNADLSGNMTCYAYCAK